MAAFTMLDCVFILNSVNLSTFTTSLSIEIEVDDQETTAFGGNGWRSKIGGLKEYTISVDFFQDFASGAVDATVWPLVGTTTTWSAKATSGATAATNPQYSGSVLVAEYAPLDGDVGDVSTTSVSWPGNGALARATS